MTIIFHFITMNKIDCLEKNVTCQKKTNLNQSIWLWSSGKNLSKQEIKDYAIRTYQGAGVTSFKASDGWYRRWLNTWKNKQNVKTLFKTDDLLYSERLNHEEQILQNNCDVIEETSKINENCHSDMANTEIGKDCYKNNLPEKSDDFTQNNQHKELSTLTEKQNAEDCNKIERPSEFTIDNHSIKCKSSRKYFPQFKAKVISYALEHSHKHAALTFNVNKDTVSGWVRQSKQTSLPPQKNKLLACMFEDDVGPDDKFIQWLKSADKSSLMSREILIEKVMELVKPVTNQEPSKKNLWFFLYAKRLQENKSIEKILIKYPLAFKQEVVSYTNNFSKKIISKIFHIDRKRICEWVNDFKNDNIKKRDVSKYLTDPNVDSKIWEWYTLQKEKPTSKEVRVKAAHLYKEAGFPMMRCSHGWYYRWRMRHRLPPVRMSQASRDSELLTWVLKQIDQNKTVLHSDLLNQASSYKGSDFQASSTWVFRFIKRYITNIQLGSTNISLPDELCDDVNNFRNIVASVISEYSLQNIIAFDEIPLNFNNSECLRNDNIVGKSGWDNCQASVILGCLACGSLLPTCLILKDYSHGDAPECDEIKPVLFQQEGINDKSTIEKWLSHIFSYINFPSFAICDAYDPHYSLKNFLAERCMEKNLELMIIPAGCSSHLQPILFGISQQFKINVEKSYDRWCHDTSYPGSIKFRLPSNNDIHKWVQKAHFSIASTGKELIQQAFLKAGYSAHSSTS